MKRTIGIILAVILTVSLAGCGTKGSEPQTGMVNPVHEGTRDEVAEMSHVTLDAPEGSTEVVYSYLDAADGEPIAQVQFTLDKIHYTYRAQITSHTDLMDTIDGSEQAFPQAVSDCTNIAAYQAGMYTKWKALALIEIDGRSGYVAFNEGKEGLIAWLDVVPGVLYTLTVDTGADQELLMDMAEQIFEPMQGEC